MRLLALLILLLPGFAFAQTVERERYEPLQKVTCQPLSLTSLIESEDCLNISGEVQAAWLYSTQDGTIAYPDAWLRLQSVTQTDFGSLSATTRLRSFHFQPALWAPPVVDTRIDEGYLAYSTDVFTVAAGVRPKGREGSIGNFTSDRSISDTLRIEIATGNDFGLGGHVVQTSFNAIENLNISIGVESIEAESKLVGAISYEDSTVRAHLTGVQGDVFGNGQRNTLVHTGLEYDTEQFHIVAAAMFDDIGSRQMLLSGSAWIGDILVGATIFDEKWLHAPAGTTIASLDIGYRFTPDVVARLSGARVVRNPMLTDGMVAASLEWTRGENLRLYGQMGQYWMTFVQPQRLAFYRLEANYEPSDTANFGISLEANELGAYKMKSSAKISF